MEYIERLERHLEKQRETLKEKNRSIDVLIDTELSLLTRLANLEDELREKDMVIVCLQTRLKDLSHQNENQTRGEG